MNVITPSQYIMDNPQIVRGKDNAIATKTH